VSRVVGYTREVVPGAGVDGDIEKLTAAGAEQVFADAGSGGGRERPALQECLVALRAGDVLVVTASERLSHTLPHFIGTIADLTGRGVLFRSLSEPALCSDSSERAGAGEVMVALERFQRRLRGLETRAGLVTAATKGRRPGRPSVMDAERIAIARELRNHDRSFSHIARVLGVSTSAVQRALNTPPGDPRSAE
jgi:DNA invertase Pin-like site-specific DNA recombinase